VDEQGSIFASFKMSSAEERSKPQPGLRRIRQYAKFGNELVPISKEDLTEMKHQANGRRDKSGLIMLGFKPRDAIPSHHSMGPTYLVYPNDDVVKGSCEAFMELHAAMLRKNVLAIGEVLHRIHWTSRLVAIYPIEEVLEEPEDGLSRQKRPPGMMVVTLPFEDDMRAMEPDAATKEFETLLSVMVMQQDSIGGEGSIKEDPDQVPSMSTRNEEHSGNVAPEELVAAAMELMGRQQLDGMELGENFDNAALEEFFNYLESVALELLVSEEEEEYDTRLDDETVLEAARDQIERFQRCLPDDVEKTKATRKRKLALDDSGLDWEDLYRSDALEDCKIPHLKSYLRSVGEPLSGNKATLVLRVTRHLRQQIENKAVKMET
jgi:ATP-dependent DNA helicase 2 subunit 1